MGTTLHWPALVTLAALVLLFGCSWFVGVARAKHKVAAPATTGPEGFERAFRVQMNTLENAVIFLPALWLASIYFSPRVAALIGAVWVAARVWYAFAYASNPKLRGAPFVIAFLCWGALMILAAWGVLTSPLW
jgi:hypothetical protein